MTIDPRVVTWILIILGVILTQALLLHLEFHHKAKGYLLRAATWIWGTLALIFLIEIVIAYTFVHFGARLFPFLEQPLMPFIIGMLAVLLPRGIEEIVFYRNFSEKKTMSSLARVFRKLNIAVAHEFAGAVRTRIEQDVFDWQNQSQKILNLTPEEFRRRIRQVYSCHVEEVALVRGDPGLLFRDVGFSPYGHLYILAEHLGRKRLFKELQTVNLEWKGDEKRRQRGRIDDRTEASEVGRLYDNEELIRRIREQGQKQTYLEPDHTVTKKVVNPPSQRSPRTHATTREKSRNQDKHRWRKVFVWLFPVLIGVFLTLAGAHVAPTRLWVVLCTLTSGWFTEFLLEWFIFNKNPAKLRLRILAVAGSVALTVAAIIWQRYY